MLEYKDSNTYTDLLLCIPTHSKRESFKFWFYTVLKIDQAHVSYNYKPLFIFDGWTDK